jgi:hypothetical protein
VLYLVGVGGVGFALPATSSGLFFFAFLAAVFLPFWVGLAILLFLPFGLEGFLLLGDVIVVVVARLC